MDEIRNIHLNQEKKFLLHDPKNTMEVHEPTPKIDEFVHRVAPVFNRFDGFERLFSEIEGSHISSRPK